MQVLNLLPIALLLPLGSDRLAHAPTEGRVATLTHTVSTTLVTDNAVLTMMGNDQDMGEGVESQGSATFVVRDEYTKVDDEGVQSFRRMFDSLTRGTKIENAPGHLEMHGSGERSSDLEGHSVEFERKGEDEWVLAFVEDDDGEEEWLEDLRPSISLESFLPEGEVDAGDEWDLETAVLEDLLRPGGELWVESPADEDVPEGGIAIRLPSASGLGGWSELEGEVTARYKGTREGDGGRLGVIEITVLAEGELDVGEEISDDLVEYDVAFLERRLEGKGELVWNLDSGHPVSLVFEGELEIVTEFAWEMEGPGGALPIEVAREQSGSVEVRAEYEIE
ncbi:MAG: hypothetical protein GY711_29135 [bacterium]|nr:hypothetical protein [bacterium]